MFKRFHLIMLNCNWSLLKGLIKSIKIETY
ncbi:CLUMA_CG013542, isoform A [Clunio marinus]|uniref:CLUMA_CG013542, isoform A n=1 Tax=Clunio marinus TaxID=568069 RepID=A0A1J1IJ55_9DIPT|nr:CLUMA_CG013542, isoform A [Clunio marinus]